MSWNRKPLPAALLSLLVVLLALAGVQPARGQFAGPAFGTTPSINLPQAATTDPALLNPEQTDLVIVAGDVLLVRIFAVTEYAPPVRVSADGNIQLPLIGVVPVGGLTVARAENLIARRLIDAEMYRNPQVTIQVTESAGQFATVSGEMHGIVPIAGERRLLDVLAVVGALPASASHVVTVQRPGVDKPIIVDLGSDPTKSAQANIPILPRDTIIISRVGVVYMLGAFRTQSAIPLQQTSPLTLLQATTLAGGAGYEGKYKDLRIIRTTGLERKLVEVNYKRIEQGRDPDPILQADDIVFLPTDLFKGALKNGGIGTLTSIASLLLVVFSNR